MAEPTAQELLSQKRAKEVRIEQLKARISEREALVCGEEAKCREYRHDLAAGIEAADQKAELKARGALQVSNEQIRNWQHDIQSFAEHLELARQELLDVDAAYQSAAKREAALAQQKALDDVTIRLANQSTTVCEKYKQFVESLAIHVLMQNKAREFGESGHRIAAEESMRLHDAITIPDRLTRLGWEVPPGIGFAGWMKGMTVRAMCLPDVKRAVEDGRR